MCMYIRTLYVRFSFIFVFHRCGVQCAVLRLRLHRIESTGGGQEESGAGTCTCTWWLSLEKKETKRIEPLQSRPETKQPQMGLWLWSGLDTTRLGIRHHVCNIILLWLAKLTGLYSTVVLWSLCVGNAHFGFSITHAGSPFRKCGEKMMETPPPARGNCILHLASCILFNRDPCFCLRIREPGPVGLTRGCRRSMENRIWIGDLVMGCILQVGWIVQMEFCPRFSSGFLFCFVSFCFFILRLHFDRLRRCKRVRFSVLFYFPVFLLGCD